ncbi:hypothetical protein ACJJIE_05965 [Microbulbifer sp. TRSA001]|uniref:hypothetical protein n=1 Tax=Microbulbifer sp. TRSA001 TaxID=3243381 RepID=UPI0040390E4D
MKNFLRKAYVIYTSLLAAGMLSMHILAKDRYSEALGPPVWFAFTSQLVLWLLVMPALFLNKKWAYFASISVLLFHQLTFVAQGTWKPDSLGFFGISLILFYWFSDGEIFTKRGSRKAIKTDPSNRYAPPESEL